MSKKDEWQKLIDARKVAEYWMKRYIQAEDRLEQYEWVSVKDRMPKPFTTVLAHYTNGRIHTVGYIDRFLTRGTVTHWMPLPTPPESE